MLCRYCGRDRSEPCRNTRDMDPEDGFNNDVDCHIALLELGGGERRRSDSDPAFERAYRALRMRAESK